MVRGGQWAGRWFGWTGGWGGDLVRGGTRVTRDTGVAFA
jgi:hypothetical protein